MLKYIRDILSIRGTSTSSVMAAPVVRVECNVVFAAFGTLIVVLGLIDSTLMPLQVFVLRIQNVFSD